MHIPARAEDFASPPMHRVTSPLILCRGVRLPREGCAMTRQLAACCVSLFLWIFCSGEAVRRTAGAHTAGLEASENAIIQQA